MDDLKKDPSSIQKKPPKRKRPNNYRNITSLPMMWKILTAQIMGDIYYSLISRRLFPKNRKDATRE